MSNAQLCLHAGGKFATREEVAAVLTPRGTATWKPISHMKVIETVEQKMKLRGYSIQKESFGLMANGNRFFGVIDLATPLAAGVALSIGLRNSIDKSLPMGFCAGSRVFVCDNSAFSAELMRKSKHTVFGFDRFDRAVLECVEKIGYFADREKARIGAWQAKQLDNPHAESLILQAVVDKKIVPLAKAEDVLNEWRKPSFDDFQPRTAWSLYNAFTTVLKYVAEKNGADHARRTMKLGSFLSAELRLAV